MKTSYLLLVFAFFYLSVVQGQLPEGFVQERIAEGLDPTGMDLAPDGRIFITEKNGRVLLVRDDALLDIPFLAIDVDNENERGLQSIVLDPDFEFNNFVYVFYTVPGAGKNRISRFTANGDVVLGGSEQVLFELDPLFGTVHNGGGMHISPEGKLLISVGDGGNGGQSGDLDFMAGKFLRLNLDGTIPEDNPFYNELSGKSRAIYAYGFRNSYGWSIDPVSGMILANDVGSDKWEEINEIQPGKFYGWGDIEGPVEGAPPTENYQDPLYAYGRTQGCAVTVSTFYRGPETGFPERYRGKYFFGDYCEGTIWVLNPASGEIEETFMTDLDRPIVATVAADGSMYYLIRRGRRDGSIEDNTGTSQGELWRIRYVGDGKPFIGKQPQDQLVPIGEDVTFSVQVSGTPPFSIQWWINDSLLVNGTDPSITLAEVSNSLDQVQIYCIVSNASGQVTSDTAVLSVTQNRRPVPTITFPETGSTYQAGDVIYFEGTASDQEEGILPPDRLGWRIDFHHNDHTHPAMSYLPGISSGFYEVPTIGEIDTNVWYRVYFNAEDQDGLQATAYTDVFPEKTSYSLQTQPSGLNLVIDGQLKQEPQQVGSVLGVVRSVSAPAFQFRGDTTYFFDQWENGSNDPVRSFEAGAFTTGIASYQGYVPVIGNGNGLTGKYYRRVWEEELLERIDSTVFFDWGIASPVPGILPEDNFTVRWTGSIEPIVSGLYTFHAQVDNGIRLWINDNLIIDQWEGGTTAEETGSLELTLGSRYPIVIEYLEQWWTAYMELSWSSPYFPKQPVPKSQLYPDLVLPVNGGPLIDSTLSFSLFPNPVGMMDPILKITNPESESIVLEVWDLQGALVFSRQEELQRGISLLEVPARQLAPGLYIISLKSLDHGWRKHLRMVKQN